MKRVVKSLLSVSLALGHVGCAGIEVDSAKYQHMICVDENGDAARLRVCGETERGETPIEEHTQNVAAAYWQYCVDSRRLPKDVPITLVIHGGLVSMGESVQAASDLTQRILDDDSYPIFVNWETGIWSSYGDHLLFVRRGRSAPLWCTIPSLPFVLLMDLGRAAVNVVPKLFLDEVPNSFKAYTDRHPQAVPDGWTESAWIDTRKQGTGPLEKSWDLFREAVPGLTRVATTPLLDAIGSSAYDNMIRRARVLFLRDEDFDRGHHRMTGAIAMLMHQFLRTTQFKSELMGDIIRKLEIQAAHTEPAKRRPLQEKMAVARRIRDANLYDHENLPFRNSGEPTFRVIAHSMGALVANELIRRWGYEATFQDIVYMGAACSIKQFVDEALPYIVRHTQCTFYNLCLHPLDEIGEWQGFATLPHGSLLVWIDSFLTEHKSELDRTLGRWNNVMRALPNMDYLNSEVRARLIIRGFGRSGNYPHSHGQFNDGPYWNEAFWNPLVDPLTKRLAIEERDRHRGKLNGDTITKDRELKILRKRFAHQLGFADTPTVVEAIFDSVVRRIPKIASGLKDRTRLVDSLRFQARERHLALGGHGQLEEVRPICDVALLSGATATFDIADWTQAETLDVRCNDESVEAEFVGPTNTHAGVKIRRLSVTTKRVLREPRRVRLDIWYGSEPEEEIEIALSLVPSQLPIDLAKARIESGHGSQKWGKRSRWSSSSTLVLPLTRLEPTGSRTVGSLIEAVEVEDAPEDTIQFDVKDGALHIQNKGARVLTPVKIRTRPLRLIVR